MEESWCLPLSAVKVFPSLIQELDDAQYDISIGQTTLEDVFLEVGKLFDSNQPPNNKVRAPALSSKETDSIPDLLPLSSRSNSPSTPNTCRGAILSAEVICHARLKTLLRTPNAIAMQICIPIMMITIAFASTSMFSRAPYVEPSSLRSSCWCSIR